MVNFAPQSICRLCFVENFEGETPVRLPAEERVGEECAWCGREHMSGIHVRINPADISRIRREATV